jgi:hypothetical protein
MAMKFLKITSSFLVFFQNRAIAVSKTTAYWNIKKQINGYHDTIISYFKIVDILSKNLEWLSKKEVFVPYYREIFGLDETSHRYYAKSTEKSYEDWKAVILDYFKHKSMPEEDDWRYYEIEFDMNVKCSNIAIKTKSVLERESYCTLSVGYNDKSNITSFNITFNIRGEPFNEYPWGKEYTDFYLPKEYVEFNRELLRESIIKLENEGFEIENFGFEWDSHPRWKIDKYGFID